MTLVLVLVLEVSQVVSVDPLAMAILGLMVGCDVKYVNAPVYCLLSIYRTLSLYLPYCFLFWREDRMVPNS